MKNEIEHLYDDLYDKIAAEHEKIVEFSSSVSGQSLTEAEEEKLIRMELALQAGRDILENIMVKGTSMTIMHRKGSFTIQINDE
ncbi:hypothetical protein GJU40_03090 [Bacillus lacus]|uniref:Uncharacterized protein n=1 Tax=Metabacillus lacus TaxID=1983721 RepID=A0A7X2IWW2_9BACI|nr:hypothetical protein [Metabacillus lacus]MRX71156.1 hypothetical protein [Metabacillus lacus]